MLHVLLNVSLVQVAEEMATTSEALQLGVVVTAGSQRARVGL